MTKITASRYNRLFDKKEIKDNTGKIIFSYEERKKEPLPVVPNVHNICVLCGQDMLVSPGQTKRFHSDCRTEGRVQLRKVLIKTFYDKKTNLQTGVSEDRKELV